MRCPSDRAGNRTAVTSKAARKNIRLRREAREYGMSGTGNRNRRSCPHERKAYRNRHVEGSGPKPHITEKGRNLPVSPWSRAIAVALRKGGSRGFWNRSKTSGRLNRTILPPLRLSAERGRKRGSRPYAVADVAYRTRHGCTLPEMQSRQAGQEAAGRPGSAFSL